MPADYSFDATTRIANVLGRSMHYHDGGEGPVLVLLHGSGPGVSAWTNFRHNLPVFANHFRCLMPDQPGFGRSELPELDRNYIAIASDSIVAFLDELGVGRAQILGNSMGGAVATRLALDHPDRVDRLVLMGPGGVAVNVMAPDPSEGMKLLYEFLGDPTRARMESWVRSMVSDQSIVTTELLDERMTNATRPGVLDSMRAIFGTFTNPKFMTGLPMWAEVHRLRHRILLAWGRDDRVVNLEGALFPFRRMRYADLHVFSNCGHWVQVERKDDFERLVIDFLTRP